jgi:uncharacterized protein (TIGR04255 family)
MKAKKPVAATVAAESDPSFDRPPVSEVACGITFEPIRGFLLTHAGLYWARIKSDFPASEHALPLTTGQEPAGMIDPATGLPLPRLWFVAADKQGLIQLQADCFYYNWRRLNDDDRYPRYATIIKTFKDRLNGFLEFLKESELPPPTITGAELTYVNHIPQEHGWSSVEDLSKVFRDHCWSRIEGRFLPAPRNVGWKAQFPLPAGGNLTTSLAFGTRLRDQMPTLKFEMATKAKLAGKTIDDAWKWFDVAHEWIVRGFVDLTQPEIQRTAWRKTNG